MQTRPTTFDICHFASIFMKCVVSDKKGILETSLEERGVLEKAKKERWNYVAGCNWRILSRDYRKEFNVQQRRLKLWQQNQTVAAESQFIQTGGEWGGKLTNTQLMNPNPKRYHESVKHPTGVHLLTAFSLCSFYYIFPSQKFSPTATWPVTWHQQSVALSILKISEV